MWTARACGCQYFSAIFSGLYVACILLICQVRVTLAADEEDSWIEQGFEMGFFFLVLRELELEVLYGRQD